MKNFVRKLSSSDREPRRPIRFALEFGAILLQHSSVTRSTCRMKQLLFRIAPLFLFISTAWTQEVPALFRDILKLEEPVRGEIIVVLPPAEIEKYISKVEQAAQKDPAWFTEYSKNTNPGVPLPYHEKLGLTKQEYDEYIALWAKREFKAAQEITLLLRVGSEGRWNIIASGSAGALSTLRFAEKEDNWKSPNGILTRLPDINADPSSILGAWTGKEWRFEEETSLSKLKENIAIGLTADQKFHLIVYRAQELTTTGTRLLDKNLVVRVPVTAGAAIKTTAPLKPQAVAPSDSSTPKKR